MSTESELYKEIIANPGLERVVCAMLAAYFVRLAYYNIFHYPLCYPLSSFWEVGWC